MHADTSMTVLKITMQVYICYYIQAAFIDTVAKSMAVHMVPPGTLINCVWCQAAVINHLDLQLAVYTVTHVPVFIFQSYVL